MTIWGIDRARVAVVRQQEEARMRTVREQAESDPLHEPLVNAAMTWYGIDRGEAEVKVRIFLMIEKLKQDLKPRPVPPRAAPH